MACDTELTPDQGTTDGSQADPTEFGPSGLRQALATAREALFQMAAQQLQVSTDQLTAQDGVISVNSNPSLQVTYGQLMSGQQFHIAVRTGAKPKDPSRYSVLGTPVPRYDLPANVTAQY